MASKLFLILLHQPTSYSLKKMLSNIICSKVQFLLIEKYLPSIADLIADMPP